MDTKYNVKLSSLAESDLSDIYVGIANSNRTSKSRFKLVKSLNDDLHSLQYAPNGHRVYFDNTRHGTLRGMVSNGYTILFNVNNDQHLVRIIRILDARSNISARL